jgi:hypothetical protein
MQMRHGLLCLFALGCATRSYQALGSTPAVATAQAAKADVSEPAVTKGVTEAECPRASALELSALREEVGCLLTRYVQIDTTNPPGNELASARFLAQLLAAEGIESRILEATPGRANLYARVAGSGDGKAQILLHHMDVVPASAHEWSVPPLSATVRDGMLCGVAARSTTRVPAWSASWL